MNSYEMLCCCYVSINYVVNCMDKIRLLPESLMIILSSPSGAGKTSLARALLERDGRLRSSVSVTTRAPRGKEVDGKDYYFVSLDKYHQLQKKGDLLESACVFGHYYGTPKQQSQKLMNSGFDVLATLDWQGAMSIKQILCSKVVTIFILPPSMEILEERLKKRATDDQQVIEKRLATAASEIAQASLYDYVVVNDDFNTALDHLEKIIAAERLKVAHQSSLQTAIDQLLDVKYLDVREDSEWAAGHITGAIHLPLAKIVRGEFELDKDQCYMVYCQHGVRSMSAISYLQQHGFKKLVNLAGGFANWNGEVSV